MNTVFFGGSRFVIPSLEVLKKHVKVDLVITTDKKHGPVPSYCHQHNIKYICVSNSSELNSSIQSLDSNFELGVLAHFGLILSAEILNLFKHGILNIHPSLLPRYRGPTPVQTTILNGDKETGVSLIVLDEETDHGPIVAMKKEPINEDDTTVSLHDRLFKIGAELIDQNINKYIKNQIKPSVQDHTKATFTQHLQREDGYIDLENPPSKDKLKRMIKAYFPWPGVFTKLQIKDTEKIVKFLPENKVQVEGGKPMSYKDFLNGYPEAKKVMQLLQP